MSLKDASVGQQLAIAGAAVSSIITLMSLKYHDRPLFYEHIKDIPFVKGYPLVGNLPTLIKNIGRRLDYAVELYEKTGALTM